MRTNVSAEPAAFIFRVEERASRFYPENEGSWFRRNSGTYQTTKGHIPEDGSFNIQRYEKLTIFGLVYQSRNGDKVGRFVYEKIWTVLAKFVFQEENAG